MYTEGILQHYAKTSCDSGLEIFISRTIIDFGIPPSVRGYQYLREALLMLAKDSNNLLGVSKIMYPEIARKYNTTPQRVERAIRHATEISWQGLGINKLKSFFPNRFEIPSNRDFLDFMHRWICSATRKP